MVTVGGDEAVFGALKASLHLCSLLSQRELKKIDANYRCSMSLMGPPSLLEFGSPQDYSKGNGLR